MWLRKANSKASASALGFIQSYREWLVSSEVAPIATPIIRQVDEGTLMPTNALPQLRDAIFAYMVKQEADQAEAKHAAKLDQSEGDSEGPAKVWRATIYNSKGEIVQARKANGKVEDLIQEFSLNQRASEWVDRRLVLDCPSDCHGVVTHLPTGRELTIERADSHARVFRPGKRPVIRNGKPSGGLGFQAKASQTRVTFSAG